VEDCSRSEGQRLEKLGRRRLRVEYREQTARETKRNADAFEAPTLLDDEVHRRDTTVPGRDSVVSRLLGADDCLVLMYAALILS